MTYSKQTWENSPSEATALSAERLNHMEKGIGDAHEGLAEEVQARINLEASLPATIGAVLAQDPRPGQGMVEYPWILPISSYSAEPYRHTILGALSDPASGSAKLLAIEVNHDTAVSTATEFGTVPANDHNAPALISVPGRRVLAQWTHHNADNFLRFKVGFPNAVATLATATEVTIDCGEPVSYGQVHFNEHESSPTESVYWIFYRHRNTAWKMISISVDEGTGALTQLNGIGVTILDNPGLQTYITTASDGSKIRAACSTNPSEATDWVMLFEIDKATGAISAPSDPAYSANVNGESLPITQFSFPKFLPDLVGNRSRRLLSVRPGPSPFAVLTCDWTNGLSHEARYFVHEWTGNFTPEGEGPPAGYDGLGVFTSIGYASSTDPILAAGAPRLEVTLDITLPATQPSTDFIDLGGQYGPSGGWRIWMGGSEEPLRLRLQIDLNNAGTPVTSTLKAPALPLSWGSRVMIRATYTTGTSGGIRLTWEYSTNGGSSWTTLGTNAGLAGDIAVPSGTMTYLGTRGTDWASGQIVHSALIATNANTIADLDFDSDWPPGEMRHTDAASQEWAITGTAVVGRVSEGPAVPPQPIPATVDYGAAGSPIWASYFSGGGFTESPRTVMIGRSVGGVEEVVICRESNGVVHEEIVYSQPSTVGKVMRPTPALGGPLYGFAMSVNDYTNEYYQWESQAIGIVR